MTMSISSAPQATASTTSASLAPLDVRPLGNAVATDATFTALPAKAATAERTRSGYTHTAATGPTVS